MCCWLIVLCSALIGLVYGGTVYVDIKARSGGDGSMQRPFIYIKDAITLALNEPPSTTTWTIRIQEGVYKGVGQVNLAIRDTKRYIIWFENRAVSVQCDHLEYFIDFTGLGGRGALEVVGNGGSIADCVDSAIRSRRLTTISSVVFLRNRALYQGSALRVQATDATVGLKVDRCVFQGQLQRPFDAPSEKNYEGGGAIWASGVAWVTVTDCEFEGNEASQGGALFIVNAAQVDISRSVFRNNLALVDTGVGGGAVAIVSDQGTSTATALTVSDTLVELNSAGGTPAGIYLGGWILLNMTRTRVVNNTSSKTASCDSCEQGVGMVLWRHVIGGAFNSVLAGNYLELKPTMPRNLECTGPWFARDSIFRWNSACDLCDRKLMGTELLERPLQLPCSLSMNFWNSAWVLYGSLTLGFLLAAGLLVGGGLWLWRRRRSRGVYVQMEADRAGGASSSEGVSEEIPLEVVGASSSAPDLLEDEISVDFADARGSEGSRNSPPVSSVASASASGGTLDGLEPPGYERPLPSSDFVRASPISFGRFKEIDYDELDLDPEPIGSGAFGLVYRAVWRGSVVAVKKYIGALDPKGVQEFRAEAEMMHGVGNHPNVVHLFGACTRGPNYCIVLPYFKRGNVRDFFRTMPEEKRTWAYVRSIALQIVAGMIHLHREGIIHRDLAARNILVDDTDCVRITDFGLARFLQNAHSANTNSNVGAVGWMAPEAVTKRRYSAKSDVWSFGVTLWELCTGELPFSGMEPIRAAMAVAKGVTLTIPEFVPADLASVMQSCWRMAPEERPTFDDLYATLSGRRGSFKGSSSKSSGNLQLFDQGAPSSANLSASSGGEETRRSLAVSPARRQSKQPSPSRSMSDDDDRPMVVVVDSHNGRSQSSGESVRMVADSHLRASPPPNRAPDSSESRSVRASPAAGRSLRQTPSPRPRRNSGAADNGGNLSLKSSKQKL